MIEGSVEYEFSDPTCPQCGGRAKHLYILDPILVTLAWDEDRPHPYVRDTECGGGQEEQRDEAGRLIVYCDNWHSWATEGRPL